MAESMRLTEKSRDILIQIGRGKSYAQIVDGTAGLTYLDVFRAAEEAIQVIDGLETPTSYEQRLAEIKSAFPRAYEKWSSGEDADLISRHSEGHSVKSLSSHFQRQPSAIRSRLNRLGLQD